MTKYRIKITTNVGGITVYAPQFNDGSAAAPDGVLTAEWKDVNWFRTPVPTEIEARAAIENHKNIAVSVESVLDVQ